MYTHMQIEHVRAIVWALMIVGTAVFCTLASVAETLFPVRFAVTSPSRDVPPSAPRGTRPDAAVMAYVTRYTPRGVAALVFLSFGAHVHAMPRPHANVVRPVVPPSMVCAAPRPLVQGSGTVRTCEVSK